MPLSFALYLLATGSPIPLTYICADLDGQFFALTVYSVSEAALMGEGEAAEGGGHYIGRGGHGPSKGRQGSHGFLTILSPRLIEVDLVWRGRRYQMPSIRVSGPQGLMVDARPVQDTQGALQCFSTVL